VNEMLAVALRLVADGTSKQFKVYLTLSEVETLKYIVYREKR